jgi:hypothetical protein
MDKSLEAFLKLEIRSEPKSSAEKWNACILGILAKKQILIFGEKEA